METSAPKTVKSTLLSNEEAINHFFTTRTGGISSGVAASLNMGLTDNDLAENVISNRKTALEWEAMPFQSLVNLKQIHSDKIFIVTAQNILQQHTHPIVLGEGDALITNVPQLPIMVLTADCVPVLLFDKRNRVIAAIHAGWRGTVESITAKTVDKMKELFSTNPTDIIAAIGPSIGVCCYEIGIEVEDTANEKLHYANQLFVKEGDKTSFDLWKANKMQLRECGVPQSSIDNLRICSKCNHTMFFSSRADKGNTGRMGSVIMIK